MFRFNPRSRCSSSSRCCYRTREHVDSAWSRRIRHGGDSHPAMSSSRDTFSPLALALFIGPQLRTDYVTLFRCSWRSVWYQICDFRVDISSGIFGWQNLGRLTWTSLYIQQWKHPQTRTHGNIICTLQLACMPLLYNNTSLTQCLSCTRYSSSSLIHHLSYSAVPLLHSASLIQQFLSYTAVLPLFSSAYRTRRLSYTALWSGAETDRLV